MAARRNKTQARRNQGNGLPGWAWMVLGILLTLIVVLVAPKYLKSGSDGFFRPQPNPDARPAPVSSADDEILPRPASQPAKPGAPSDAAAGEKGDEFAFYDMLTGKEVPMTDAELAATQRAEAERQAAIERAQQAADASARETETLPQPVDPDAAAPASPTPAPKAADTVVASGNARTAAGVGDGSRYLLQAGAFQASGQAEELKAKIALLGLGARVESAQINGKTIYRVRMGPYGTAGDLADAKQKLESNGLDPLAIKAQ
ncbi:SPOR domain-containing protein [Marilutibacter aestuarii]|uniref:Sporulation protein n=1 Tax=Marilutibacter aestuarii TaxID=1706195 RepID=A0A508AMA8_9GAMM|nr:SPOR domain-containing protein [Lysobacter aestuarii]TQD51066.1 sporulation protein [Lysobacter aestuarii]